MFAKRANTIRCRLSVVTIFPLRDTRARSTAMADRYGTYLMARITATNTKKAIAKRSSSAVGRRADLVRLYSLVGKLIKKEGQKWLVVAAYPLCVMAVRTCDNGYIVRECFGIGELVQMGMLQKGDRE